MNTSCTLRAHPERLCALQTSRVGVINPQMLGTVGMVLLLCAQAPTSVEPPPVTDAPPASPSAGPLPTPAPTPTNRSPATLPSLAVIRLQARNGASKELADLFTGRLANALRRDGRFSRVVSEDELAGLLDLERQKQLMDCSSSSCMAEIAGAMGVEQVVSGTLGKAGGSWVINASRLDARAARVLASSSQVVKGSSEESVLEAVPLVVAELMEDQAPAQKPPAPEIPGTEPGPSKGSFTGRVLIILGALPLPVLGVVGLLGLVAMVGTVAMLGAWQVQPGLLAGTGLGVTYSVVAMALGMGGVVALAVALVAVVPPGSIAALGIVLNVAGIL